VTLDHIDPICFLSLVHTLACMHKLDYLSFIPLRFLFWLVDLLSPAVFSIVQILHHYDVEYGLFLSVRDVVLHPSRCELTMVMIDVMI
jgi:hypothetical protein